jgi:hypothetical protein
MISVIINIMLKTIECVKFFLAKFMELCQVLHNMGFLFINYVGTEPPPNWEVFYGLGFRI